MTTKNYGFSSNTTISGDCVFRDVRALPVFGKPMISTKKSKTVIVNVATNKPAIAQSPVQTEVAGEQKLVAWTSVRQERWEGELVVEGEIPKWLVCMIIIYEYDHFAYVLFFVLTFKGMLKQAQNV